MIIKKCDICKKQVNKIDTIILYGERIDYCTNCRSKAMKIRNKVDKMIKYYKGIADRDIKKAEKEILSKEI